MKARILALLKNASGVKEKSDEGIRKSGVVPVFDEISIYVIPQVGGYDVQKFKNAIRKRIISSEHDNKDEIVNWDRLYGLYLECAMDAKAKIDNVCGTGPSSPIVLQEECAFLDRGNIDDNVSSTKNYRDLASINTCTKN